MLKKKEERSIDTVLRHHGLCESNKKKKEDRGFLASYELL
jgi:hypothetical protein